MGRKKITIIDPRLTIESNAREVRSASTRTKGCSGGFFGVYDTDYIQEEHTVYYVNGKEVLDLYCCKYCNYYETCESDDTFDSESCEDFERNGTIEEKREKYPKEELDNRYGNNYGRIHCYWCGTKLKKVYSKNKYYCGKCKK